MALFFDRVKTLYVNYRWRGRLILAMLIVLLLLVVIRLSLPHTIIYSATSWLQKQGIDSSIESIDINLIDGSFSLINASGSKHEKLLFNVGLIEVHWSWRPLSEKTFEVTKLRLDGLAVDIQLYSDSLAVGGLHLPLADAADGSDTATGTSLQTSETKTPWAASLGQVVFSNLDICYQQHNVVFAESKAASRQLDYCMKLQEMSWSGTISYASDRSLLTTEQLPIASHGSFALRGLAITDNKLARKLLSSSANELKDVIINGLNDIHIGQLDMNGLSAMQRDDTHHKDTVSFAQLIIDDIRLSDLNALTVGAVKLSSPGLYLLQQSVTDWEYMQWLPAAASAADNTTDNTSAKTDNSDSAFSLSLNNLMIEGSDFCYQQTEDSLYYCLTLENLNWHGAVHYDTVVQTGSDSKLETRGELSLSRVTLVNHNLKRKLVDLASLRLSDIKLTDSPELSFGQLTLNGFTALQRSEKDDDNTLSFATLEISQLDYADKDLVINDISLNALASTVSKNSDGSWEHDKWLPHDDNKDPEPVNDNSNVDSSTAPQQHEQALSLSLNRLNINTDKHLSFIDNSTQPALTVGLTSLLLEIEDINSAKPETSSSFKLQANTSRHASLELAGTARPFAEKISLDANGQLKGFDLRAVTPATKKAIGHIISSGQLDADLDLRASDGVLDSNVGLSLYHFHIKPVSKADSEALDSKFGMPLNQTLVLLRDKDDSIHLDIPITGDVTSPAFNPYDAIIKATSKAATVTLITFYTPYGLVYAGGNALFDIATALNFDPLEFNAGSSELTAANKEQLDMLAGLMTDKPQIRLTLCGVSSQRDVEALFPPAEKSAGQNAGTEKTLSAEQLETLSKLAHQRQGNSKDYLVAVKNIEHNRLVLCEPEHSTATDAIAGVEINI